MDDESSARFDLASTLTPDDEVSLVFDVLDEDVVLVGEASVHAGDEDDDVDDVDVEFDLN